MTLLLVIIGIMILLICIGIRLFNIAVNPKISKKFLSLIFSADQQHKMDKECGDSILWLEKNAKEVEIISKDGLKLKGYEIKNENSSDKWVITVHGYMGRGADMVKYVQQFKKMECNGLIIDLRAHGKSEGKYIGMGWLDHYDLTMWIEKLVEENPKCKIILYGISMGAATVMMTVGEDIPKNVKLAIEDCGYTSVWDEFGVHIKRIFHISTFPLLNLASLISKVKAGYSFKEASSIKQIKKCNIPILFIHGKKDKFVPFSMLDEVYNSASCKKEKLEVEDAAHAESSNINPELYWKTINRFFKENIK